MDADRRTELEVGLFVIGGIALLFFALFWIKGNPFSPDTIRLRVRFEDAAGLEVGDPVMVRGVERGRVRSISLDREGVLVVLDLKKTVFLASDLAVWIADKDVMGGKEVRLDPGRSDRPFDPSRLLQGRENIGLLALMERLGTLVVRLDEAIASLQPFLASGEIQAAVSQLRLTTKRAGEMLEEMRPAWVSASRRFESASRRLDEEAVWDRVRRVSDRMERTLARLDTVGRNLNSPDGTWGKMVLDKALYERLLQAVGGVDTLLAEIRANPKKYFKFSLF